jgi:hypothetical protein
MSAFVVNKSHINAIIQAAFATRYQPFTWYHKEQDGRLQHHQLNSENANATGQMLLDECVHSVQYRYEDDTISNLPGPINAEWLIPFEWRPCVKQPTPLEAIKLIKCYEYQSCEHPEWETSEAKDFCDYLTSALICQLEGYDGAAWEWHDTEYYKTQAVRLV